LPDSPPSGSSDELAKPTRTGRQDRFNGQWVRADPLVLRKADVSLSRDEAEPLLVRDTFGKDLVMSDYGNVALLHRFDESVAAEALVDEEGRLRL
jgi:hypothetical protein